MSASPEEELAILRSERDLLQEALVTLFDYVTFHLDPEPGPIEDYFGEEDEQQVAVEAERAVRARQPQEPPPPSPN